MKRAVAAGRSRLVRWLRGTLGVVGLGFFVLNLLAFAHARSFMTFAKSGRRPPAARSLSWSQKARFLLTGVRVPRPRNEGTPRDVGLTYSRVVVSGHAGIPLEAWLVRHDSPRGSVLLFHGYGDSKDSLLPMARAFYDLGFSLLIVDFYGSGGSGGSSTSVGYFEAEDVAAAFDATTHLPLGRPIVLHGVSMGGAAILRAADVHHLPADALILEAPFDRLLTTVRHRFDEMGAPAFPAADLLLFWGGVQQGFDARGFAPVEHARRVSIPTLLLVGARDPYVRRPEAEALAASLAGPRQLEIVPGLPHRRCILVDPARWRRVVAAFLDAQLES